MQTRTHSSETPSHGNVLGTINTGRLIDIEVTSGQEEG